MEDITNNKRETPRAIPWTKESVTAVDLHVFADASIVIDRVTDYITVPHIQNESIGYKTRTYICTYGF